MARTLAHGAVLYMGDGASPEVFDSVPYIGDISFSYPDAELVDVTSHTDEYHEELPGLQEIVEIDVPIVYDTTEATHTGIRDLAIDHAVSNWKIVTIGGETIAFQARVRARNLALGIINKAESFTMKLRVNGTISIS